MSLCSVTVLLFICTVIIDSSYSFVVLVKEVIIKASPLAPSFIIGHRTIILSVLK
jgi:hypothetical protein